MTAWADDFRHMQNDLLLVELDISVYSSYQFGLSAFHLTLKRQFWGVEDRPDLAVSVIINFQVFGRLGHLPYESWWRGVGKREYAPAPCDMRQ